LRALTKARLRTVASATLKCAAAETATVSCEACRGDGIIKIEMHFLPEMYVQCDVCGGKRYNHETLEVKFRGFSIADVLDMTVEAGADLFKAVPAVRETVYVVQTYIAGRGNSLKAGGAFLSFASIVGSGRKSAIRVIRNLARMRMGLARSGRREMLALRLRLQAEPAAPQD